MNSDLKVLNISAEDKKILGRELEKLSEVTAFSHCPELAERISSLGIAREVGTINDEMARFIFDAETQAPVVRESLKAEIVQWGKCVGVRIWSDQSRLIQLRAHWIHELTHPSLSYDQGRLTQLVFFPRIISEISKVEGAEIVLVKKWAMNSIFGGFDPAHDYYQTNFWELENNDSLQFSDLLRHGQIALLGTHDLIAHIAGIRNGPWLDLRNLAAQVYSTIKNFMAGTTRLTLPALVLTYTVGVVLDDLAQPPSYGSRSHLIVLKALLAELDKKSIRPDLEAVLTQFPPSFERVVRLAQDHSVIENQTELNLAIQTLIGEIKTSSLVWK